MKILFVDDEPFVLRFERRFSEAVGHECVTAETVEEAEKIIKENGIDLAVFDTEIGQRRGFELVGLCKEVGLPFIGTSGDHVYRVHWMELGALYFLQKPFRRAEFQAMIAAAQEKL